jgi:5-methylcytosine-specific restriction endonuclease McrA
VAGKVKFTELTIDHVVPRSKGGKTTWVNVCTSCKDCNSKKGDDGSIVPKKVPHRPTYYEILTKRKNMPVYIKDDDWRHYLDWPDHLIILDPMR